MVLGEHRHGCRAALVPLCLTSSYKVSGCLLTDAQVRAYDKWRAGSYFRAYDTTLYPASATAIITPISELGPYLQ